jgi:hypothetical protein
MILAWIMSSRWESRQIKKRCKVERTEGPQDFFSSESLGLPPRKNREGERDEDAKTFLKALCVTGLSLYSGDDMMCSVSVTQDGEVDPDDLTILCVTGLLS